MIVLIPDHCLSIYFGQIFSAKINGLYIYNILKQGAGRFLFFKLWVAFLDSRLWLDDLDLVSILAEIVKNMRLTISAAETMLYSACRHNA